MSTVTVSNGHEFFRISAADLASATQDGFYRPLERGLTIVGNDQHLFEIPLSDVEAARASGYQDLLEQERTAVAPGSANTPPRLATRARPAASLQPPIETVDDADVNDEVLLFSGLSQAEIEAEELRLAREQELEEAEGWDWYKVFLRQWLESRRAYLERQLGSHGISIAIHVAIFLLLASLMMVNDNEEKGLLLTASPASRDIVQEVVIEPDVEVTDPTEVEENDPPPESQEVEMAMTDAVTAPDFMAAISGDAIKPPSVVSQDSGTGKKVSKKASSVFGTQSTANDYVFVIDNSNSMTRGRFETALNELVIAVNALNKKQRFYVIFYSDTAYGMMYPNPVTQLVYATDTHKQQMFQWLGTVQLCLKTNGKEAIQAAFNMDPDVIYVLGDGAFTDGASKYFAGKPRTKATLHTRGMEVSPQNAKEFARLAKAHGGNYKDVGVAPGAAALAQRNPRKRNNKRDGVWGITLGAGKK
ncbi:MAG: VWA domain-containing protein [Pirellulaceae bacterium]|nr:VWA domain-containing protein [Pirellulaceae bacterium]